MFKKHMADTVLDKSNCVCQDDRQLLRISNQWISGQNLEFLIDADLSCANFCAVSVNVKTRSRYFLKFNIFYLFYKSKLFILYFAFSYFLILHHSHNQSETQLKKGQRNISKKQKKYYLLRVYPYIVNKSRSVHLRTIFFLCSSIHKY